MFDGNVRRVLLEKDKTVCSKTVDFTKERVDVFRMIKKYGLGLREDRDSYELLRLKRTLLK